MGRIKNITLPDNTTYDIYGKNVQNITWSDYQNLTSEQKNSDTAYLITDVPSDEIKSGLISPIANTPTTIATFNASALPMPSLSVGIEAVQAGSGDPSPTNVRPISGWSAVNVYDVGDNWGDCADIPEPLTANKWYSVNLPYNTCTISFDVVNAVRTALGNTLLFAIYDGTTNTNILADKIYSVEDGSTYLSKGANISGRFYFTYTGKLKSIGCYWRSNTYQLLTSGALENIMIEVGNNPTKQYIPYNGTTTPIQFTVNGETKTIYIGYVEIKNGKVKAVATHGLQPLTNWNWTRESAGGGNLRFRSMSRAWDIYEKASSNCISSVFKINRSPIGGAKVDNTLWVYTNGLVYVYCDTYTDTTEFKEFVKDTQLLLPLITPIEYDLADVSISTQDGTNNIWADTGDIQSGEYFHQQTTQIRMNDKIYTGGCGFAAQAISSTVADHAKNAHTYKVNNGVLEIDLCN